MSCWRLLDFEYPDAPSNLALEEAMTRQIGEGRSPPTLRLWRNRNAAIIGENQSANSEVQLDTCRELGVDVVRRFTGGGAVYHDLGNLNYSICARKVPPSNPEIHQGILTKSLDCAIACLDILGLESSRIPINTIVVRRKKISGGAGAIRWGAVVYHGSILVSTNLENVWKTLRWERPPNPLTFVQSNRLLVTSINAELGRDVSLEEVKKSLKYAFEKTFSTHAVPGSPAEQELETASALAKVKYGADEWNLKM